MGNRGEDKQQEITERIRTGVAAFMTHGTWYAL